jgi:hypothetical protein
MPYVLGIDIGSSTTTAAVCRTDEHGAGPAIARPAPLDVHSAALPSVLELTPTGEFMPGGPAAGGYDDDSGGQVVQGFLRRVGDDTPIVVGGDSYHAHALTAALARWVVDVLWEREEAPAHQVALTHPTSWGPYRVELLRKALSDVGLAEATLLTRAAAAVESYAATGRLPAPGALAVYRLGGSSAEAAIVAPAGMLGPGLRGSSLAGWGGAAGAAGSLGPVGADRGAAGGWELLAAAELDDVGGAQLAEAPSAHARPLVQATVDLLARTVRSHGVGAADVAAVLLAGGAAGNPLVTELLGATLDRPVLHDDDPQLTVAKGAALAARRVLAGTWVLPNAIDARHDAGPPAVGRAVRASVREPGWDQPRELEAGRWQPREPEPETGPAPVTNRPARPPVDVAPLQVSRR